MTRPIIEVENIAKLYRLGPLNARTLREEVERLLTRLSSRRAHPLPERSEFWALKDISFLVQPGEIVGLIGKNGAGKSTLLKILSRITEPTRGQARIRGRVGALLEIGTGFHPELTGRENVYLNGAILGMTRAEVKAKFDEICAFAEVEKFVDTPVKRYSSGMLVRLAFAVAAHLEPEILIVDEVLAVGDVFFQKKCIGKMKEVNSTDGRTVLIVSHNMNTIYSLCDSAIVLEQGSVAFRGSPDEAIRFYLRDAELHADIQVSEGRTRTGTGEARVLRVRLENAAGQAQVNYCMGDALTIVVTARFATEIQNPIFGVNILTDTGVMVADCRSSHSDLRAGKTKGMLEYRMRIDSIALYPRNYVIEPWITDSACLSELDWVRDAARFVVTSGHDVVPTSDVSAKHGIVFIPSTWSFSMLD